MNYSATFPPSPSPSSPFFSSSTHILAATINYPLPFFLFVLQDGPFIHYLLLPPHPPPSLPIQIYSLFVYGKTHVVASLPPSLSIQIYSLLIYGKTHVVASSSPPPLTFRTNIWYVHFSFKGKLMLLSLSADL